MADTVDSFIHFESGLSVRNYGRRIEASRNGQAVVIVTLDEGLDFELFDSERFPEFGRREPAVSVRLTSTADTSLRLGYTIEPHQVGS